MPTTGVPAPSSPTGPSAGPQRQRVSGGLLDPKQLLTSFPDAVRKLDPRAMFHHPVLFVVEVGAVLTTLSAIKTPSVFAWVITAWLWLTSVFANLAEAVAEGRGKAQAETLRRTKTATMARPSRRVAVGCGRRRRGGSPRRRPPVGRSCGRRGRADHSG